MRKSSVRTERIAVRGTAVSDCAVSIGDHSVRTVGCVNLRPGPGADGRCVLQGVGRPKRLCSERPDCVGVLPCEGGEALLLWREPELFILAPGMSEPESIGSIEGSLYGATLCGKRLLVNSSAGVWHVEWRDGRAVLGRVATPEDFDGIALRGEHCTILRSTVASRKLQRDYLPGETVVDGTDARRLGSDIGEAYERLCAMARSRGSFVQPVLARYKVYDRQMNELYSSAPVLLSHPDGVQCSDTNYLRSLDRRKVESYELTAQTWRMVLDVPAELPAEAAYVTVFASAQFHPYDPDSSCAVSLSRSTGSGNEFGHLLLPGELPDEAALRQSLRGLDALERPVASFGLSRQARTITVECGAAGDVRAELANLRKAWKAGRVMADGRLRRFLPPHSFAARRGCAGPSAVLWGDLRVRRYNGYPLGQFAATAGARSWRGWIKVNFADGSSVTWSGGGDSGAPLTVGPVLSYPSADAVNMVIGLQVAGEAASEQSLTLRSDPVSGSSVYVHSGLRPFVLQTAEDGQTVAPASETLWAECRDTLLLAPISAPRLPAAVYNPGKGTVNALAATGGSQSAWDFGRPRFYAFCSGGILAVSATGQLDRLASTSVDRRECLSQEAVTVADGNVWAVASGDLVRLQGHKAASVRTACGYSALAWNGARRELLGLQADGSVEVNACDYDMSRFRLDYRLGGGRLYSPHGQLILLTTAEGIYNLAQESGSRLLDVEWVVNLEHRYAAGTCVHALAAEMEAGRFSGTVSISRRNGQRVAPAADAGLIIHGTVQSVVGSRMIARPARGWQLRVAGNASDITISEIRLIYEKHAGYTGDN